MRTLRRGLSENPQGEDSVRTLREGTQCEPSGRGLSENTQGRNSVRTLREGTQCELSGKRFSDIPLSEGPR